MLHVYTMDQVHALAEAAHRNVAFDLIEAATAFRMASTPDNNAWKRYVQHLEGRTKKQKGRKEAPAVMTREQAAALKRMSHRRMN